MSQMKSDKVGREKVAGLVAEMNDALRAKYREIRKLFGECTVRDVRSRYKVGLLIRGIRDEAGPGQLYGTRAVGVLAESLGRNEDTLYRYAGVTETWNEKQIEEILKREDIYGRQLSWSHLVALARVTDAKAREQFLAETLAKGLSARTLEKLIDHPASRGRSTRTIPATVQAGLRRLIAESQAVTSSSTVWEKAVFDRFETLPSSQFDKSLRQALEKARDGQLEAQKACRQNVAKLDSCIAKVGAALTGKKGRSPKTVPLRSSKPKAAQRKPRRSKSA